MGRKLFLPSKRKYSAFTLQMLGRGMVSLRSNKHLQLGRRNEEDKMPLYEEFFCLDKPRKADL